MPAQYRALWTVPGGGAGFSIFHTDQAGDAPTAQLIANQIRQFFVSLASQIPDDVNVDFDSEVVDLDASGTLQAAWPVTPPSQAGGSSTAVYNRASGARIEWGTGQIVAGRRLRGRTYIVPCSSALFDTQGLLTSAAVTALFNAADDLVQNLNNNAGRSLQVWSRTHAVEADVTSITIPPDGAILRSRRD